MAYPDDIDHGVALWKGVNGSNSAGYVQSSSFKKGYETVLNGKDESGLTKTISQGNANTKGSFEMLVFESSTPPTPGSIITFESHLTGSVTGWIVMDVDAKESNTDYTRVTVSVEYWNGLSLA
jgi:hypothetical protein